MSDDSLGMSQLEFLEYSEGTEKSESALNLTSSKVMDELKRSQEWTEEADALTNGSVSWRPHLCSADGKRVLHIHLVDELRSYLRDRLQMAVDAGTPIVVALLLKSLYESEVVEFLGEIDADIILIDADEQVTVSDAVHILTVLSDRSVPVNRETRTKVARRAWANRAIGNSYEKGRRFEGLLAFLLGQVVDFKVIERNFRGATDEVDIVLQIDNWSKRCWHKSGSPFILVEAKNWQGPVGQSVVTIFNGKLRTKRRTTWLGLLFSASTFTSEAAMQELKFAQDREVVAMIDGERLTAWIDSDEPDDYLEEVVRHAMLR